MSQRRFGTHLRAFTVVFVGWAVAIMLVACDQPRDLTSGLAWAFPTGHDTEFGKPLGPGPFRMPGSELTLTRSQMEHSEGPIDWYPNDHPPAPEIVRGYAGSKTPPCAECHAFNGTGFPGSADLTGLSAAYIVEQVRAFRSGERRSADPHQPDTAEMIKVAQAVTPGELARAAEYFARLPRARWLRVVESKRVPRTVPDKYGWLDLAPGGGTESVGDRVVEVSDDLPRSFLGDDHVMLTDYAPPGSVTRGRSIVETGGATKTPCSACHGLRLQGTTIAPPIAGRPAAYVARTLWDIRVGARGGQAVAPMKRQAKGLTPLDIRDVAAYLASLTP